MARVSFPLMALFLSLVRGRGQAVRGRRGREEQGGEGRKREEGRREEGREGNEVALRLRSAKRHSRFVAFMRYILPVSALVLAVLLLSWPGTNGDVSSLPQTTMGQREMINLHYRGVNRNGEPLSITAARAVQSGDLEGIVDLFTISGTLQRTNGRAVTLSAAQGHYDYKKNHLVLEGDVRIVDDAGYDLLTPRAEVSLDSPAQAWGNAAVSGTGPGGQQVRADGFRITDEGRTIILSGRSQLVLPSARKEGEH